VKKIIGILLALSLVLSLTVMAMPAAADVTDQTDASKGPKVVVDPNCACIYGEYTITFNTTASLTEGVHCVCVKFPAGTGVPATGAYPDGKWKDGDITIEGDDVFAEEITVSGTEVCFLVPKSYDAGAITVVFKAGTGTAPNANIVNPCEAGWYKLEVYTCREPDATPVLSQRYKIVPCYSPYVFVWDSSPTYEGLVEDFVPPFKACGQEDFPGAVEFEEGKFMNAFNLTFRAYPVGCFAPCPSVDIYCALTAAPQFPCLEVDPAANVTLNLTGPSTATTLNTTVLTYNECDPLIAKLGPTPVLIAENYTLAKDTVLTWEGLIHFDTVGEYTICFWAECPGTIGDPCEIPGEEEENILVERCIDFDVHQWKDAGKIYLGEKWNLISLPLVPFETDIDTLLGSVDLDPDLDKADNLISIWHYDAAADDWDMYPGGGLTDMVDGESYWVRMTYPNGFNYTWWVWGTAKAMPPAAPSAYPMEVGWNMFGFTSLNNMDSDDYLWNFGGATNPYPLTYGWDNTGDWGTSDWDLIDYSVPDVFETGQGYWGYFPTGGTVVPP